MVFKMFNKKKQLIIFVVILTACFVGNIYAASELIEKIFPKTCTIHVVCQDEKDLHIQVPVFGMDKNYFLRQDLCNTIEGVKKIPVANQLIYSFEHRDRLREGCEYSIEHNKVIYLFEKSKDSIV